MTTTNSVLILGDKLTPFNPEKLRAAIIELYNNGYRDFYTPLTSEFECAAAEIISSLNVFHIDNKFPDLNLKVVVYYFIDHLRSATPDSAKRFAKILDSAHEVIFTRSPKNTSLCFNATEYALKESSLLLTCVDPNEMKITCQGYEELLIEDFPMFVTYNIATCKMIPIVNLFS